MLSAYLNKTFPSFLIPPLHIKQETVKEFVKALKNENEVFKYIPNMLSYVSNANIESDILIGQDVRRFFQWQYIEGGGGGRYGIKGIKHLGVAQFCWTFLW